MERNHFKDVAGNVDAMCHDVTFFLCPDRSARHFSLNFDLSRYFFLFLNESARHFGIKTDLFTLYILRFLSAGGLRLAKVRVPNA